MYPPSCPTERPAGFQDDALVYLSQFHAAAFPPAWRISLLTPSGPTPFRFCNAATAPSTADGATSCSSTGSVAASLREIAWDPDATTEKDPRSSYFVKVLDASLEDPCTVFLPSECTSVVTSGQGAAFFSDWQSEYILCSPCQRSHTCRGSRHCSSNEMMIDTVKIRGPTKLRRGSHTASSAKRKTHVYRGGSNASR